MPLDQATFNFSASAYDTPGKTDDERYQTFIDVTEAGYRLGFETVWMAEHNFTDYYPIPSPLLAYAYVASRFPGLGLGTCVLVTPWYDPIRLASEISMLTVLTGAPLHLGVGRGTAPIEYEIYRADMRKSVTLFREGMEVIQLALKGEPFTYDGEEYKVSKPIQIRPHPHPELVNFYGAVIDPKSTEKVANLGFNMLGSSWFPFEVGQSNTANFDNKVAELGGSPRQKAVWVNTLIRDSDEEAVEAGRHHVSEFFKNSVAHYEHGGWDTSDYLQDDPNFAATGKIFSGLKGFADINSEANEKFIQRQFIGSPQTVRERVQKYIDIGYDRIIVQVDLHSVSREDQIRSLTRFAEEVAPEFSTTFQRRMAAV